MTWLAKGGPNRASQCRTTRRCWRQSPRSLEGRARVRRDPPACCTRPVVPTTGREILRAQPRRASRSRWWCVVLLVRRALDLVAGHRDREALRHRRVQEVAAPRADARRVHVRREAFHNEVLVRRLPIRRQVPDVVADLAARRRSVDGVREQPRHVVPASGLVQVILGAQPVAEACEPAEMAVSPP